MATVTRTLAVNAAFLKEIKLDHRELRDLLDRAASWCERPHLWPWHSKEICHLLARLRDQLALHFSLEEAYGYFEDALAAAPQLSERAEVLRSQHGQLFLELGDILSRMEQVLYKELPDTEMLRLHRRYEGFRRKLADHEAAEGELIIASCDDDIGVGD